MSTKLNYNKIVKSVRDENVTSDMSIWKAKKLLGIEDWKLTNDQERFLVHLKTYILDRYDEEWILNHRQVLQDELMIILQAYGPIYKDRGRN